MCKFKKVTVKWSVYTIQKHGGGVEVRLHLFITSAEDALYPTKNEKRKQYALNMLLVGHQSRSGRFWRTENILPPTRFEAHNARPTVNRLTALP